ncbi:phospholipase D/nuclease [Biscogniauxia marginata]|nr:phospholipase D/nuclease [Biscogniauxia marginata]
MLTHAIRALERPPRGHSCPLHATSALYSDPERCLQRWNVSNAKPKYSYHVLTKANQRLYLDNAWPLRMAEPLPKRRRLGGADGDDTTNGFSRRSLASLSWPISPPGRKRDSGERVVIPSPFQLTTIESLPPESNVDAVSLHDLLGDPLISECWEFNYLHDVDFLMSHFDEDTRALVNVHIVHGFWQKEDPNRLALQEQASKHSNVTLHSTFMPEPYGTHHSKLLVLFRRDDTAQVIIHTANMISKDWTNMTNGVWQSPRLPRMPRMPRPAHLSKSRGFNPIVEGGGKAGGGSKFKFDLLNYLRSYNARWNVCRPLVYHLAEYDFSSVRGSLIASVPGRRYLNTSDEIYTRWGWPGLEQTLRSVPGHTTETTEVVIQISSIATLGMTELWLQRYFFETLSVSYGRPPQYSPPSSSCERPPRPEFKVVFPTADEIRRSLGGYASGGSIHTKVQTMAQNKQYQYLLPILCHWANDAKKGFIAEPQGQEARVDGEEEKKEKKEEKKEEERKEEEKEDEEKPRRRIPLGVSIFPDRDAGRKRAAPHIKTYIRYSSGTAVPGGRPVTIDWALLTSANLSKQAWGEAPNKFGEVRIASYEIGVLVWPDLLASASAEYDDPKEKRKEKRKEKYRGKGKEKVVEKGTAKGKMVATFRTDVPSEEKEEGGDSGEHDEATTLVGLRVPYNLPLRWYNEAEFPWVASASHTEPDWMGNTWQGF